MHSNDSGRPLRQFLTYYRPHRRLFALDMLFALLSCAADLAFPYVSRQAMLRLLPLGLYRTFFAVMAGAAGGLPAQGRVQVRRDRHRSPLRRAHRGGYASGAV